MNNIFISHIITQHLVRLRPSVRVFTFKKKITVANAISAAALRSSLVQDIWHAKSCVDCIGVPHPHWVRLTSPNPHLHISSQQQTSVWRLIPYTAAKSPELMSKAATVFSAPQEVRYIWIGPFRFNFFKYTMWFFFHASTYINFRIILADVLFCVKNFGPAT